MKTCQAKVRVAYCGSGKLIVDTRVQADTTAQARALLEAQYGQGNVVTTPMEVRD